MERVKQIKVDSKDATLWMSRDAEGRKVYGVTMDRDGVSVEPTSCSLYTQAAAIVVAQQDATAAEQL